MTVGLFHPVFKCTPKRHAVENCEKKCLPIFGEYIF